MGRGQEMAEIRNKMDHITKEQFNGIWNYYLSLESDLSNTSRYVEPSGQEEVHSFEFAKLRQHRTIQCTHLACRNIRHMSQNPLTMRQHGLRNFVPSAKVSDCAICAQQLCGVALIILSCTEVESLMKIICFELTNEEKGNIGEYKQVILGRFPNIVSAYVTISRLGKDLTPFAGWDTGHLQWWESYGLVKHRRDSEFERANYQNAATALSAVYVLIFYLAKICGFTFSDTESNYIHSGYAHLKLACAPSQELPDFITGKAGPVQNGVLKLSTTNDTDLHE